MSCGVVPSRHVVLVVLIRALRTRLPSLRSVVPSRHLTPKSINVPISLTFSAALGITRTSSAGLDFIWIRKFIRCFCGFRPVFLRCFIRCFCDWRFLCALFNDVLSKHDCYDSNHKFIVLSDRSNIEQIVKRGVQFCMPLLFLRLSCLSLIMPARSLARIWGKYFAHEFHEWTRIVAMDKWRPGRSH